MDRRQFIVPGSSHVRSGGFALVPCDRCASSTRLSPTASIALRRRCMAGSIFRARPTMKGCATSTRRDTISTPAAIAHCASATDVSEGHRFRAQTHVAARCTLRRTQLCRAIVDATPGSSLITQPEHQACLSLSLMLGRWHGVENRPPATQSGTRHRGSAARLWADASKCHGLSYTKSPVRLRSV